MWARWTRRGRRAPAVDVAQDRNPDARRNAPSSAHDGPSTKAEIERRAVPLWLNPHWVLRGFLSLFRRSRLEREMDDELRFHLECRADDLRRAGLSADEAWRRARVEFGGVEPYKERCRQAFGVRLVDDLTRDLTYASRSLRRTPGFTITAASAIALGVAVNAALFSLVYAILLRPLPIADPATARNIFVEARGEGPRSVYGTPYFVSFAEFTEMRAQSRTSDLAAVAEANVSCKCRPGASLRAQLVSDNLLPLIGATPVLGRFFTREESSTPGSAPVIVLSWIAWQQIFGGAQDVVGRGVLINRTMFTIIGVADERATGPLVLKPDVWMPFTMQELTRPGEELIGKATAGWIQILARLRPGVTDAAVRAELSLIGQQAVQRHSPQRTAIVTVAPAAFMNYPIVTQSGPPVLALLFVAVSLVLLIGCANVANMLLARGVGRQREIAIRLAIGAGRRRLFQQFLVESALLGLLGGALGLALSQLAARLVMASLPASGLLAHQVDLSPDWRIVAYTALVSLLASLVFGGLPALRLLRADVTPALKADTWQAPVRRRRRVRLQAVLIAGQAAVTLVLLVNAGLLLRGFDRALHMDRGQLDRDLLIGALDLTQQQYAPERAAALVTALRERALQAPGVLAVSTTTQDPLVSMSRIRVELTDAPSTAASGMQVSVDEVGVDYFRTMHIALRRGRAFEAADMQAGARAIIVDESLARAIGEAESQTQTQTQTQTSGAVARRADVIGRVLRIGDRRVDIVGIVAATRGLHPGGDDLPRIFLPVQGRGHLGSRLLINHAGPREPIVAALQQAVEELDPNISLTVKPIEENISAVMAPVRIVATAVSTLGLLALVLGCTGLYGVVAFSVGRRRREIGIRLTLGATRGQVLRMILGQGLAPVLAGGLVGLLLAAAGASVLRAMLYGLSPFDPVAFGAMTMALVTAAVAASLLPARAALAVDPAVTLRHE